MVINFKKFLIILLLCLYSLQTINAQTKPLPKKEPTEIDKIASFVKEKTPSFISNSIISGINTAESLRIKTQKAISGNMSRTSTQLEWLKSSENKTNNFSKPIKQAELFFLKICNSIFTYKIIFYGILLAILFYMVRYIWRSIM